MSSARVERIEAKVQPNAPCYRVDWGNGKPSKCPYDPELEVTDEVCDNCQRAIEWHVIEVK